MTYPEMKKVVKLQLKQVLKTRDAGQKEYAHDIGNVFANFERSSELLDIPRDKALMVFLLKHIDGIAAYVKGHKSQREDVTGRITDAIVYLCLLRGMIEDGKNRSKRNSVRSV